MLMTCMTSTETKLHPNPTWNQPLSVQQHKEKELFSGTGNKDNYGGVCALWHMYGRGLEHISFPQTPTHKYVFMAQQSHEHSQLWWEL